MLSLESDLWGIVMQMAYGAPITSETLPTEAAPTGINVAQVKMLIKGALDSMPSKPGPLIVEPERPKKPRKSKAPDAVVPPHVQRELFFFSQLGFSELTM